MKYESDWAKWKIYMLRKIDFSMVRYGLSLDLQTAFKDPAHQLTIDICE